MSMVVIQLLSLVTRANNYTSMKLWDIVLLSKKKLDIDHVHKKCFSKSCGYGEHMVLGIHKLTVV